MSAAFWWRIEQWSGRAWHRLCKDGVTCWFDSVPAWAYRHRKNAERRAYKRRTGEEL